MSFTPKPKQKKALWFTAKHGNVPRKKQAWRPISKVSQRMAKLKRRYNELAKQWRFQHPFCEFCRPIFNRSPHQTTEVHHKKGRGKYLLDVTTFGAACRPCHIYIHQHPKESYEKGWMIRRNL